MTDVKAKRNDADTLIRVLLDKSGSMNARNPDGTTVREQTIKAFNDYLKTLHENDPGRTLFTLCQFDSGYNNGPDGTPTRLEYTCKDKPFQEVEPLTMGTYVPSGGTPLYDAVGKFILQTEADLKEFEIEPNVLLVIITDGGNTDYHGFQDTDVKGMLEKHDKEESWTVTYLGANQDAWKVGSTLGVSQSNSMNYTTGRMGETMTLMAASTAHYAGEVTRMRKFDAGAKYGSKALFAEAGLSQADYLTGSAADVSAKAEEILKRAKIETD